MTIDTVAAPADLSNWQSLSKETLQKILAEKKNGNNLVQLNRLTNNSNNDKPAFVWYRGMVQDMYDPEYHRESPAGEFTERQPLMLVPIPFTSPWTRCSSSLEDENVDMKDDEEEVQQESSKKREREEESEGSCSKKQSTGSPKAATDVSSFTSQQQRQNVWSAGCMGSNPMETPVLAHFYYESSGGPTLKLNDIVEVIGVVEPPPPPPQQQDQMMVDGDDDFFEEPTPPQVPCLRVASHRKVNLEDLCPAESDDCKLEDVKSLFAASLGSEPAAEALFLSLFSQAERQGNDDAPMMTPHNGTLGCASLNFVLPTVESCTVAAHRLQSLLENMFPVVGLVDLLHQKGLLVPPGKSGRTMQPSPLALPKGSVLIIAENRLNGKLTPEEAETLQAMQCMTKNHSVPYKFEGGMQFNFEADYRIVVLSVGHVSKLMPCSLSMALKQQQGSSSEQLPSCSQRHLQSSFVNTCSKPNTILLGRPVLDVAQQDFIERRRQARTLGQTPIEEEDFHRWLTLTRLHARSQGRQSATTEDWKNALRVDDSMRAA